METPVKKWFRLAPGQMVRLKSAYIVRCESFLKDEAGNITEIHCTYLPESKSGHDMSHLKVKGTIHWVNSRDAVKAEVRLYDRLFKVEDPSAEDGDFKEYINPDSLQVIHNALIEPSIRDSRPGAHFQFMRNGYFCVDRDSGLGTPVFNRTVTLKEGFKVKEA
jgi:glutaminyl-tRNA synthetase